MEKLFCMSLGKLPQLRLKFVSGMFNLYLHQLLQLLTVCSALEYLFLHSDSFTGHFVCRVG